MLKKTNDGLLWRIAIRSASCSLLGRILSPSVPNLWIPRHSPHPNLMWTADEVRLSSEGPLRTARVRGLTYDLQIGLGEFLTSLMEFDRGGILLAQTRDPLPDRLPDWDHPSINHVLLRHGLFLKFNLPHRGEVAVVSCVSREHLESFARIEELRDKLIDD